MVELYTCNSVSNDAERKQWDSIELTSVLTVVPPICRYKVTKQVFTNPIAIESVPLGISQNLQGANSSARAANTGGIIRALHVG